MEITINANIILRVIETLKQLDVRGYESMDKLVGTVILMENILKQAEQIAMQQAAEAQRSEKPSEEAEPKAE